MRLQTARLTLRHAQSGDLADLHAVLSDPRAMRWWSTLPHASLAETRTWLDGMIAGNAAGSDDYVIERDGRVIGKAGFSADQLGENFKSAMDEIVRLKPSSSKGRYIQKGTLSTTFGPGVPLDVNVF